MKINFTVILIGFLILLSSQSLTGNDDGALSTKIKALESQVEKASKLHALWRDTRALLTQAKAQHKKGNSQQAQSLINTVQFQLEQSLDQAHSQSDMSSLLPFYLTN